MSVPNNDDIRDYFAGMAPAGLLAANLTAQRVKVAAMNGVTHEQQAATEAYAIADAMIAERDGTASVGAAAADLYAALVISRAQWIHSVNAEQCLAAIEKAEGAS